MILPNPWDCQVEGCATRLQPVDPSTGWYDTALAELNMLGMEPAMLPAHQRAFLVAHTAHRLTVHDDQS